MYNFDNWYLYVVVNNDLESMNPGKAEAHSGHAASAFVYNMFFNSPLTSERDARNYAAFKHWLGESETKEGDLARGFGTQINLATKPSAITWYDNCAMLRNCAYLKNYPCGFIQDPTYPFEVNHEIYNLLKKSNLVNDTTWDPDRKVWKFTRAELTAFWVFADKTDYEIREILDNRFELKK